MRSIFRLFCYRWRIVNGGFSPLAIAIHIVYFDEANELRVKHFVSDSNNDRLNPAKKFFEAVDKEISNLV
ncbi:sce7725 family protein [Staphylococcus aureus]